MPHFIPTAVLMLLPAGPANPPANPAIDMAAHIRVTQEAAWHRETRRLSEADFLAMSRLPGVIVLDARSKENYDRIHIKGAINLSFSDIDVESLAKVLPDKSARILIYCNNNFLPFPGFAPKGGFASLNLSTYATLYGYGYRNVYELAPQLHVETTILPFERSSAKR